jgi:hypothetical protein
MDTNNLKNIKCQHFEASDLERESLHRKRNRGIKDAVDEKQEMYRLKPNTFEHGLQ